MREEIGKAFCETQHYDFFTPSGRRMGLAFADKVAPLFRQKVEGIENPYLFCEDPWRKASEPLLACISNAQHDAVEQFRRAVLALVPEEEK